MNAAQTNLSHGCRDDRHGPHAARRGPAGWALLLAVLLACVSALGAGVAQGQISASDKAAAEALFDEGLRLLRQGRNAEACVKLEQSQSIEHGIGTMLYLADCYERIGRVASAWALFREAASLADQAGQSERAGVANERAQSLESRLPRLTIEVPPESAVDGLEVRRGGKAVPAALWGVSVPVDPGEHIIEALAPGHQLYRARVAVQEGQTSAKATIPVLEQSSGGAVAPVAQVVESASVSTGPEAPRDRQQRQARVRMAGWVLGAVGVAGLAGAGVMGGLAIRKDKRADARCSGSVCENQQGLNAARDAKRFADMSTGLWVAGGVLTATGLTLILVGSRDSESRAEMTLDASPGFAGLRVSGGF